MKRLKVIFILKDIFIVPIWLSIFTANSAFHSFSLLSDDKPQNNRQDTETHYVKNVIINIISDWLMERIYVWR